MNIDIIFRRIKKNKKWFSLNVLGLSIALACILMVFSFVRNELSYDKIHSKADRICRVTQNTNTGKSSMIDARMTSRWVRFFNNEIPQIENVVRLSSFRNAIVSIGDNSFFSKKVFGVDSSFFEVFDFELLIGNEKSLFKEPKQLAITESMAIRYFGTVEVLEKQLKITHAKIGVPVDYTIKGVLKDFPGNSHFKADFLCSIDESQDRWAYTYLLMLPNMEIEQLKDTIQAKWDKIYEQQDYNPLVDLQPITEIHLHSNKSRELEQNGNMRTLYLLISGVLVILIIALINFANLNYVQYLSEQKNFVVKAVNGATPGALSREYLKESLVLMGLVAVFACVLVYYLSNLFSFNAVLLTPKLEFIAVSIAFFIIVSLFAALPFLYRKINKNLFLLVPKGNNSNKVFVVLQLLLSIVAIIATMFLQKQINHINLLHPDAKSADLIVMPNNPRHLVNVFETFKQQALNHPEILNASSVMEEPAGIVTDNFPYILDGQESEDVKTINILTIDSNFFSFFNIKPIAGTVDIGATTTLEWEQKAIQHWQLMMNNQELPEGMERELKPFRAKYIINKMALGHLGIESAEKAIGRKFKLDFMGKMFPEGEIIGVVDDFHYTNMYVKEKPLVMVARKMFSNCFLFRINPNQKRNAVAALKSEWDNLIPTVPFYYEFVTESYKKVYQNEYNQMRVLMVFALISILLSVMGLFAMVSFTLKMKVKEIGVRRVNGAMVREIMVLLNKDYLKWVAIAFVLACPISYFVVSKWLENFAYKTMLSWWVFALAGVFATCIALLTVSWLTYRAARNNPIDALRYE